MFASKVALSSFPNIHLVGMFCMTFTLVYREKALVPIYIYVFLEGLFYGFTYWWVMYLYVWALLWGAVMLFPKKMNKRTAFFVYPIVCSLHGAMFGVLCAPVQAVFSGYDLKMTLTWIASGLPFDMLHAAGNFVAGFLVIPLSRLLIELDKKTAHF